MKKKRGNSWTIFLDLRGVIEVHSQISVFGWTLTLIGYRFNKCLTFSSQSRVSLLERGIVTNDRGVIIA